MTPITQSKVDMNPNSHPTHRVVVVGGCLGGLQTALKLARQPVEVTLIDRRNFHLFQPLAYQVATGRCRRRRSAIRCAGSSAAVATYESCSVR